ncbi:MAG: hypothetical protein VCF24_08225, partial [Candidatus Latescibacterota bacterium]
GGDNQTSLSLKNAGGKDISQGDNDNSQYQARRDLDGVVIEWQDREQGSQQERKPRVSVRWERTVRVSEELRKTLILEGIA